ncbi:hypothetical protein ACKI2N_016460 [Cupriavidus sp. 30B13]|uniref:hypothetical protein n=1 Tax=Cupriavidus sp. 30B13 TaxID=3384241 RepID=UPI003B911316
MTTVRYTLLADGTSDGALMAPLQWLIENHFPALRTVPQFAQHDLPAGDGLRARVEEAVRAYPCEVLFVHRDAERLSYEDRLLEIETATKECVQHWVPIVPVRMTEAWLLGSERAIRAAAGNPNGREKLRLPLAGDWERLSDPKEELFDAIRVASGLKGRRLAGLPVRRIRALVAEKTPDFEHLRVLPSFRELEKSLITTFARFR